MNKILKALCVVLVAAVLAVVIGGLLAIMPVTAFLVGLTSAVSFTVIGYWHFATRGTWMKYSAGRSLMGLLGIIAVGFGYGFVNQFLGQYPARTFIGFFLYAAFIGAIIVIGFTIRKELIAGRKARRQPPTGPIRVTVAEETERTHG